MSLELKAKAVFDEVRALYKSGNRADNKNYDMSRVPGSWTARASAQNERQPIAEIEHGAQIGKMMMEAADIPASDKRPDFVVKGDILLKLNARTINCGEAAFIACHKAGLLGAPAWLLKLGSPADHEFCCVGAKSDIDKCAGVKLADLTAIPLSVEVYAVDVWLNTLCRIQDYGTKADAKLRDWGGRGKRISWSPDPNEDPDWHAADGEYRAAFMASKLVVAAG